MQVEANAQLDGKRAVHPAKALHYAAVSIP